MSRITVGFGRFALRRDGNSRLQWILRGLRALATTTVALGAALGASGSRADETGLPNFHQVSPGIYRGAAPTQAGLERLKAMGIRTVIDLRIAPRTVSKERALVERLGMRWVNLPMSDQPPTRAQVDALLSQLRKAPREPVFVHCQHGADRTGCMLGIYRETAEGWSYEKTYQEMRKYGFKPYYVKLAAAVRQRAQPSHGSPSPTGR